MRQEVIRDIYCTSTFKNDCCWCNEAILVQHVHAYMAINRDDSVYTQRAHLECREAMRLAYKVHGVMSWSHGAFKRGSIELADMDGIETEVIRRRSMVSEGRL